MTFDIEKLEALATACGDLNWRAIQENWCEWAIRDDHAYIAIMRTKSAKQAGPCSDREAKAKFLCAVTPAAVLELIADSKQQAQKFKDWQASHHANYVAAADERDDLRAELAGLKTGHEAYERVNAELRAENEKLRANASLQKLMPEVSDALEELEIHGQHSDQGYRKLKDWYRKVLLACRVIQSPMFEAKHGDLVSQNTWLRKMVEHYAQQHAPLEPIPDVDGWSSKLPGYDLPTLLRDAERWRCVRNAIPMQSPYAVWREGSHVVLGKDADDLVDNFLSTKEQSHD
ncbi:hypothetical protein [Pseudomonas viridiflava]|uniref:hypothetical protein n=1 Tax=Pseudomonas viridiflava TaxID=33069 RepID=UPI000F0113ED|nr:hypothetical protein [Pseudomonas viridiflava]